MHLLVWGITEAQHREMRALRENIYDLQEYLAEHGARPRRGASALPAGRKIPRQPHGAAAPAFPMLRGDQRTARCAPQRCLSHSRVEADARRSIDELAERHGWRRRTRSHGTRCSPRVRTIMAGCSERPAYTAADACGTASQFLLTDTRRPMCKSTAAAALRSPFPTAFTRRSTRFWATSFQGHAKNGSGLVSESFLDGSWKGATRRSSASRKRSASSRRASPPARSSSWPSR